MRIKFLSVLISILLIVGCATTLQPRQQAMNSLLATQQTVIALAQEGDLACKIGVLNEDQCMELAKAYARAKIAYDFATDQMLLLMNANPKTTEEAVLIAIQVAEKVLTDFINLSISFQLGVPANGNSTINTIDARNN